jgi:hypothetical protein
MQGKINKNVSSCTQPKIHCTIGDPLVEDSLFAISFIQIKPFALPSVE